MQAFEAIRLEVKDGLALITLTDAERGNPIDGRLCCELNKLSILLSTSSDVRAVLLRAEGRAFSYGGDIASFTDNLSEAPQTVLRWTSELHSAISRLQRMDAPTVVAVHGVCAGGMAAFVAGADIVVGSLKARFAAAYAGIGFSCDAGASVMFSRRMGLARARRFLLRNEVLEGEQALSAGLLDELVSSETLELRSMSLAQQLAAGPTRAFGETRRLLLSASGTPLEHQLELEAQALVRIVQGSDAQEGLVAFRDKRPPRFEGR